MKVLLIAVFMTTTLPLIGGDEIPARLLGRWSFDEEATAIEWPAQAKDEKERAELQGVVERFRLLKQELGKPLLGSLQIDKTTIEAHDSMLDPHFDVLSVVEKGDQVVIQARHFQVPDDDNPKVVTLKLHLEKTRLVFELWDYDALQLLYVLRKTPNQSSQTTPVSAPR